MRGARPGARLAALLVAGALALGLAACDDGDDIPGPTQGSRKPAKVALTLGVWGDADEVASYQSVVDVYNTLSTQSRVKVRSFDSDQALEQSVDAGDAPDVFLVSRPDLAGLLAQQRTKPLGSLLDDRGVDLGDGYSRTALEAFSADRDLQCMPWGISPQVIFYNRALVDFDAMAAQGLDVPGGSRSAWSLQQFEAAAQFAAKPRRGIAAFSVSPTLRGLGPWVESAGGSLFEGDPPGSLAFSSDDTKQALQQVLPTLTSPRLNLTAAQLAEKTPTQWFEQGKLAMIAGYRSLVPQLRQIPSLDWDVISMPNAGSYATVGDLTALCVSATTKDTGAAADLLVDLISTASVRQIVRGGYLAPANSTVALSEDFLQPGRAPDHAAVFNGAVRSIQVFPLFDDYAGLDSAEAPLLQQLLEPGGDPDLDTITRSIDDTSVPYFSLPTDSASPSASSSASDPDG